MKNRLTKVFALFLAMTLAACSSAAAGPDTEKESETSAQAPEAADTEKEDTQAAEETEETVPEETEKQITFEEFTAIDNDECTVTITGLDPDSLWGYTVKAVLENKSDSITYMFSVESASVNDVRTDPLFAEEVAPGKKANADISFTTDVLKENGITDYTDIELVFRVYDSNDWTADAAARETVHIYPYGEDAAESFVREASPDDIVLADNDDITAVVTGFEEDSIWGYTVNVYFLNRTDKTLMFSVDEASVNGFMADPFFAASLNGGKCAFSSISWSDTTLEENGITDIEEIEFNLHVYDYDDLMGGDIFNEKITLNP
ncbi:MAG: hypothetical protein K6G61_13035 [Solobacterium sp.]|nr:hypothetical protein [Solobacterium sp.]